jgi:acetyl-CoA C-acetyltransferase
LNDGGAFSIVTSASYAEKNNLTVWAKVVDYKVSGVEPEYMGMGPVPAIKALLERSGLDLQKDVGILEINEAFAAQRVACLDELGVDMNSDWYKNNYNPNGGGVSLGHPLGMLGARIMVSILHEFKNHPEYKYGIGSACIGGGMGIAILLENGYHKA